MSKSFLNRKYPQPRNPSKSNTHSLDISHKHTPWNRHTALKQFIRHKWHTFKNLPLREGDTVISNSAWGRVITIQEQPGVYSFCYNNEGHLYWLITIHLLQLGIKVFHLVSTYSMDVALTNAIPVYNNSLWKSSSIILSVLLKGLCRKKKKTNPCLC